MPKNLTLQVTAETKSAEDRLKALQKVADQLAYKKVTIAVDENSINQITRKTSMFGQVAKSSLELYKQGIINADQANMSLFHNIDTATNKAKSNMQSLIDGITGVERETSQITSKTSMFGRVSDEVFSSYTSGVMSGADATQTLSKDMKGLGNETEKTSGIFDSLTKRFTAANLISTAITFAISKLRQALREAVTEMKEMDKELTTIKMVTGASDYDISKLSEQAFAGARANGRSVNEYLTAAERFARAGYRDNIDQLSKLSLMTQNIGGVEEDVAAKFLLAADAAWKLGGSYDALMGVLDGVSAVADQNATDLGKIAEGITVAGSAFANAGESAQTFTAMLGVTTASTQRSGSEMARGLRTILFRVRQVKAEFDDGEVVDAKSISNAAKALDDVGISVLNKEGDLKSMSEILTELSAKWSTLSKSEQAYLQNYLAGNRNGNVLFALMDNWGAYEKMLSQYEESSGTALEKNARYTESWAAATENLNTAWVDLVGSMTENGGLLQGFIENIATPLLDKISAFTHELQKEDGIIWFFKNLGNYEWAASPDGNFRLRRKDILEEDAKALEKAKKATEETDQELVKYTDDTKKAADGTDDLTDSTEKAATAFEKQRTKISEVAKAIKEEKNTAVDSLADIYKAAMEAADKGLYGSNAYRKGGSLFFSEEGLAQIKEEGATSARKYLDAYFKEIESGDYSTAAANFFDKITGGSNEIKDDNKQVIASMKDLGDSFEWTFDKGSMSMDEYLKTLSSQTGISETFWASMIESLGMYSDELAKWTESNEEVETKAEIDTKEAEDKASTLQNMYDKLRETVTTKVDALTKTAQDNVANLQKAINNLRDKTVTVTVNVKQSGVVQSGAFNKPFSENDDSWIVSPHNVQGGGVRTRVSGVAGWDENFGADIGYIGRASGKRDSYSGIALVNDEYPANGSKPELIISPSTGSAYIANGGKPALVNLASDDIVLSASETRSAFGGVPAFAASKGGTSTGVKVTTPKSSLSSATGKSSKGKSEEKTDPTDTWNQFKKLVDYMMDQEKDILDDKLAILDKQLAELEAARKSQKNVDELAQKLVKVDEAQLDVLKAQTERTVRYYNESTNQWEWMADQGVLAEAEKAYSTALKDLNDFLVELNFEEQKANIKAQKDALQEAYDTYKKGWDTIIESIEAPTGDLAALFAELKVNGTDAMKSQTQNIETLLGALEEGFYTSIDDAALANAESLAKTFDMLEKSSSDSQKVAQEAIDNILGRSSKASQDVTGAAQLALGDMSTISSTNVTELMGEAQRALNSMTTDTEYTGEGMAQTLSDATVDITGAAAEAIKDIVQNANDFLDKVKQAESEKAEAAKAAETAKSSGKSGGGGSKKEKKKEVIGETKGSSKSLSSTIKSGIADTKSLATKAVNSAVKNVTTTAMKSTITNNNGGNTYINGVNIGPQQMNAPLSKVLSNIKLQTNSTR